MANRNGNGALSSMLLKVLAAVLSVGIVGAFTFSMVTNRALGQIETRQEDSEKINAVQHQRLADSIANHEKFGAHPMAAEKIRELELDARQTNFMVQELYRRGTHTEPPPAEEIPE